MRMSFGIDREGFPPAAPAGWGEVQAKCMSFGTDRGRIPPAAPEKENAKSSRIGSFLQQEKEERKMKKRKEIIIFINLSVYIIKDNC